MKLSTVMLALAVSTATSFDAQRIQPGYMPATKRARRKAARQKYSNQPLAKEHKDRNKKGKP